MPSPVRNFTAAVNFDMTKNKIIANLSWIGPESPYGKIDYYKIVLSSPRAASLIGSTTLDVKVCNDIYMTQCGNYNHTCKPTICHGHGLVMIFMTVCLTEEECILYPQDTAAAQDMRLPVDTHIVSDLLTDEYFNFSVRVHAS